MTKIPVTIVTGALGAGKTTFVNQVLTEDHGLKIGVIVNEFGDIGIDGSLIVSTKENLRELANGCICCDVRGDLLDATKQILKTQKIDYLMIETSGLAEVAPVANTFILQLDKETDLDSIICIIDAENYHDNVRRHLNAVEQLHCSDIVLLNKTDLVSIEEKERVKEDILKKLPNAHIIETVKAKVPIKLIIGITKHEHKELEEKHLHDKNVKAISLKTGPVDTDKIQDLLEKLPDDIYRAKGIICVKESQKGAKDELRIVFHKVGKRVELEFSRPWEKGEQKETKIVFIGININKEKLQKQLESCK